MAEALDVQDLAERATAAAQEWSDGCVVEDVTFLPGGTVSLVYTANVRARGDGVDRVVLKVAPPGLAPIRNRDVLRQARCIEALSRMPGVTVPDVLFTDAGAPPEVPPFFATPFLGGECVEPILDPQADPAARDVVRIRAFSAVDVLVATRKASIDGIGLQDEAVMTPADEVRRWVRTFETVPDDLRVGYEPVAEALLASAPELIGPSVVHGDYRLGNMLCESATINGIIDWELWTVSDPRIDLSWLLFFADDGGHPSVRPGVPSGMPPTAELVAAYEGGVGEVTKDLEWFGALTAFKEASATSLILKLARRRNPGGPDIFSGSFCTGLIQRAALMVGA